MSKKQPKTTKATKNAVPAKVASPKTVPIHFVAHPSRKKRYVKAAQARGMGLSAWLRMVADGAVASAGV